MTTLFRLSASAIFLGIAVGSANAQQRELEIEPARNLFVRFGTLSFKMNNKSEDARDVTGSVLSRGVDAQGVDRGLGCKMDGDTCDASLIDLFNNTAVRDTLFKNIAENEKHLGIPPGVKARVSSPTGAIATVGMYLDEDNHYAVEVPVAALPFSLSIYGAGSFQSAGKIATAKALGLIVMGHRYFGPKNAAFRPSISLAANYLFPFDMKSTAALEAYTGGRTSISGKGSLGLGWLVGGKYAVNDKWDVNFNIGQFKAKVESTLTTYDTVLKGNSPIFSTFPGQQGDNIQQIGESLLTQNLGFLMNYRNNTPGKQVNGGANLGTFVRTQKQTLDPYVMVLTVGYNF